MEKKNEKVLEVLKKALNLQQKSIKQQTTLITNFLKTKIYEKENFTLLGVILYDDSNVGISH